MGVPEKPKRRKKSKYDGEPIRRMEELVRSGVSRRKAAAQVAQELGGNEVQRYFEGLRKQFRALERRGELPGSKEAETQAVLREIERAYEGRRAQYRQALADLEAKEAEAREIGLVIAGDPNQQCASLDREYNKLTVIVKSRDAAIETVLRMHANEEEAKATFLDLQQRHETTGRQLVLMREIAALKKTIGSLSWYAEGRGGEH